MEVSHNLNLDRECGTKGGMGWGRSMEEGVGMILAPIPYSTLFARLLNAAFISVLPHSDVHLDLVLGRHPPYVLVGLVLIVVLHADFNKRLKVEEKFIFW